ncbi:hypothetical protein CBR_g26267 [Chara braunii]|uniref:FAS1 domain-containing protein n=1 Tax=Chara braunii TaxID=69332 RepID=A0A388L7Q8_CHABU|nr:hypothetical protein CBR_g26267 [Chara braunii]|eukprot:GBG78233.1 hypothetical protein CBR_g26267 [Chara braunii]
MKTAMKHVALIVAFAFFLNASPQASMAVSAANPPAPSAGSPTPSAPIAGAPSSAAPTAATAKTGKDSKVFQILKNETEFSMFYEALVNTTEIWNVQGRTVLEGKQLILFAPTNLSLISGLGEDVITCLQKEPGQAILRSFLEDLQVVVPINVSFPQVNTTKQLLNLTTDGSLWTVAGRGIAVSEEQDGSIKLTSDGGVESVTVQEARVTDPTVTLIPLESTVIVEEVVAYNITRMCLGGQMSESSNAAPSSASLPASESSSEEAGADQVLESTAEPSGDEEPASSQTPAQHRSLSRKLWDLLF